MSVGPILIVEDEDLVRIMIAEELQSSGYDVLEASCAEEALVQFQQNPVSVLFTDIRMPGRMNGWELAEEVHRRDPSIKVIYTTGYSHERPRLVPNSLYVGKPYRAAQIVEAIERLAALGDDGSEAS